MVNKNFGKILLITCLTGGLIMSIWAIVLKNRNKLVITPTENFLPTETSNKYVAINTSTPQKTMAHNMGTILLIHSEAGKVSLVRGENRETFQISTYPIHFPPPVLSPEGTRIAFFGLDGYLSIYDVLTQETTTYTDALMGGMYPLGWSPDGEKIAYQCPEIPISICIFTLNTGHIKTFANMQDASPNSYGGYTFAGWSSDGEKIGILYYEEPSTMGELVRSYNIGTIKILDVDTEEIRDVFTERDHPDIEHLQDAVLSPDGSSFLFSAMSGDYYAVYQVQTDGSGLTRITGEQYPYHILHPVWQPDGQGFVADAPEPGKDVDHAMFIPTVFDLSGNIINQITVENSEVASSWIANDISIIQE